MSIRYELGNEDLLEHVKELWEQLNELHREKSPYFKKHYSENTFEKRIRTLTDTAENGRLLVALAYDGDVLAGYCIASASGENGEIESIFVSQPYRGRGIASKLFDLALDWLRQQDVREIVIKVSIGNEDVFGFYTKRGFFPRLTELRIAGKEEPK